MSLASIVEQFLSCIVVVAICAAIFLLYFKIELIEKKIDANRKKIDLINKEDAGVDMGDLASLAITKWRLEKNLEKIEGKIDSKEKRRFDNTIRQLGAFLDTYNVKAEDYTGRIFRDGMNVDILSVEADKESDKDYIKETEKPAIYVGDNLLKPACVILARGIKNESELKNQEETKEKQEKTEESREVKENQEGEEKDGK